MIHATYSQRFQAHPTRRSRSLRVGFLSSRLMSFLLLALLALLYIAQSSQVATKQLKVQALHSNVEKIGQENKQLELEAARAQALWNIEESTKDLQLEPVQSVEFLTPQPNYQPSPTTNP